jgi:tetratricopeptide (TPR) repeat protein
MSALLAMILLAAAEAEVHEVATPPQAAEEQHAPAEPLEEATAERPQPGSAPPTQQLRILPQDSRMEVYEQYRELYELARFEEALPYAKRVVELSEAEGNDFELAIAHNNLGATQYQLRDFPAAEASYRDSLELLESTQGISSRRLVTPLAGLGAVYAAQNQHAVAAELFDRALAVSRRADGLFNLEQLPLIDQAADSRYAIKDFDGAEREYLYALKIAEQNYGYGDARTLPALLELGAFYESLRGYIAARNMYMRARDIALRPGVFDPVAVKALCGIARTHRLQFTLDPHTLESPQLTRDEGTGSRIGTAYDESRVPASAADRNGLKSAQLALELLRSTSNPPPELMTETLLELGDWFQAMSRLPDALPYYTEAASIFDAQVAQNPQAGHPLQAPRLVFYRPPASASRGANSLSGQYVIRKTVFSFGVSETGRPVDINVVSSDMEENQLSQSQRAISRAVYSPRFDEGRPVSTAGVTFTSEWYQDYDPEAAPTDAKPDSTRPEEAAAKPPESQPASSGSGPEDAGAAI